MSKPRQSRGSIWPLLLVAIALAIFIGVFAHKTISRASDKSRLSQCLNNLRQISTALAMYQEKYNELAIPDDGGLPVILAEFITDSTVFHCPCAAPSVNDSYSTYYIPRSAVMSDGFIIGCPNHSNNNATAGIFGINQADSGANKPVLWNGTPVKPGDSVTGGILRFADGAEIVLAPEMTVVVVASFERDRETIYSAIRVARGALGWINVSAPHGAHFDVATPACTAGIRGTKYSLAAFETEERYSTAITVTEGTVAVANHIAPNAIIYVSAGQSESFDRFKHTHKTAAELVDIPSLQNETTIFGPEFHGNQVWWRIANNTNRSLAIERIALNLPNSDINEVRLDEVIIWRQHLSGNDALLEKNWACNPDDLRIQPNSMRVLKALLAQPIVPAPDNCHIDIQF